MLLIIGFMCISIVLASYAVLYLCSHLWILRGVLRFDVCIYL